LTRQVAKAQISRVAAVSLWLLWIVLENLRAEPAAPGGVGLVPEGL